MKALGLGLAAGLSLVGWAQEALPLPDVLRFADGKAVTDADGWTRRRVEVANAILPVEYGHLPVTPAKVEVEPISRCFGVCWFRDAAYITYRVRTDMDGQPVSFLLHVWRLKKIPGGKCPVLLEGDGCWQFLREPVIDMALKRGWMVAQFNRCEIARDDKSSVDSTLFKWAWTYHRAIDALRQVEPCAGEIAITGHSRGGKTVLLAGATDARIAAVGENCSGCCGAGCLRDVPEGSETIAIITERFPYWFDPGWSSWAGREKDLPFDQHFLEALIAPRKLFIRAAKEDSWANPAGCRRIYEAARPVWQLLGAEKNVAYSLREGGHDHSLSDFEAFLDFASDLKK